MIKCRHGTVYNGAGGERGRRGAEGGGGLKVHKAKQSRGEMAR